MERIYPVFTPEENINADQIEHSEVIDWCYKNQSHSNVLILDLADIYLLQEKSKVLDIINEENDGMLQVGEDDWIISSDVKLKVQARLNSYAKTLQNGKEKEIVESLLKLLEISIVNKKNLYFIF